MTRIWVSFHEDIQYFLQEGKAVRLDVLNETKELLKSVESIRSDPARFAKLQRRRDARDLLNISHGREDARPLRRRVKKQGSKALQIL